MPTKKELENTITELKQQVKELNYLLNESAEQTQVAIDVIHKLNAMVFKYEWKKIFELKEPKEVTSTREWVNFENHIIRDADMLDHFHELLAKEKSPYITGTLDRLRDNTYDWAVEKGYFTNKDTSDEPLSQRRLSEILPKPKIWKKRLDSENSNKTD